MLPKLEDLPRPVREGLTNAYEGAYNTVRHPIDTMSAMVTALRSPLKTGKEVVKSLRQDFKDDPIRTLVENLVPTPGLPGGSKARKIVVPEALALDHEIGALRRAADELSEGRIKRPSTERSKDFAAYQDDMSKNFSGWYPGKDGILRKELQDPTEWTMDFLRGEEGEVFNMIEALRHPDLHERFKRAGLDSDKMYAIRGLHDERAGSIYKPKRKSMIVAGEWDDTVRDAAEHELQHMVQDAGYLKGNFTGTDIMDGMDAYVSNQGEIEARISALRRSMDPQMKRKFSQPWMQGTEETIIKGGATPNEVFKADMLKEAMMDRVLSDSFVPLKKVAEPYRR